MSLSGAAGSPGFKGLFRVERSIRIARDGVVFRATGNTYPHRSILKRFGWWDRQHHTWVISHSRLKGLLADLDRQRIPYEIQTGEVVLTPAAIGSILAVQVSGPDVFVAPKLKQLGFKERRRNFWVGSIDAWPQVRKLASADVKVKPLPEHFQRELDSGEYSEKYFLPGSVQQLRLPMLEEFGVNLLGFQREAIEWMMARRRTDMRGFLVADEMGLGKTVEALAALHVEQAFPAAIVCPAFLRANWEREIWRALPSKTVQVVRGRQPAVVSADVWVLSYESLPGFVDGFAGGLGGVVFDECHYLKNARTARAKAAAKLVKRVDTGFVLGLSGTPVVNHASELANQLRLIGWGGYWTKGLLEKLPPEDINNGLRSVCMVRRRKSEVLDDLPELRWVTVSVDLDTQSKGEYLRRENEFRSGLSDGVFQTAAARMNALTKMNDLRVFTVHHKLKLAKSWIDDFLESGEQLVVFLWHKEPAVALAKEFDAPLLTGDQSHSQRMEAVDAFQAGKVPVIVCTIAAAGMGLTMTAASNVLFVEQAWTPAAMDQALARCHRIGQRSSVTGWVMLARGTIDERMAQVLERKRDHVDRVTDGAVVDDVLRLYMER